MASSTLPKKVQALILNELWPFDSTPALSNDSADWKARPRGLARLQLVSKHFRGLIQPILIADPVFTTPADIQHFIGAFETGALQAGDVKRVSFKLESAVLENTWEIGDGDPPDEELDRDERAQRELQATFAALGRRLIELSKPTVIRVDTLEFLMQTKMKELECSRLEILDIIWHWSLPYERDWDKSFEMGEQAWKNLAKILRKSRQLKSIRAVGDSVKRWYGSSPVDLPFLRDLHLDPAAHDGDPSLIVSRMLRQRAPNLVRLSLSMLQLRESIVEEHFLECLFGPDGRFAPALQHLDIGSEYYRDASPEMATILDFLPPAVSSLSFRFGRQWQPTRNNELLAWIQGWESSLRLGAGPSLQQLRLQTKGAVDDQSQQAIQALGLACHQRDVVFHHVIV